MDDQEITIAEYELESCNNNMKTLLSHWDDVPHIDSSLLFESSGDCKESLDDCVESCRQTRHELSQLLNNTITFLEKCGVSFAEADTSASKNINKLTT